MPTPTAGRTKRSTGVPAGTRRSLYLLMSTIFIVVMSELQVAGMLPEIAADLDVSTGQVGALVSVYALGMALGGPLIAFVLRHSPPKRALLTVVASYAVLEVVVPLVVSLLTIGAAYASFSYFTPMLEENAGFSTDTTTLILLAYGVCTFIGNLVAGRFADEHAVGILRIGHALLFVSLVLLAGFSDVRPLVLVTVLIVGFAGVSMNPPLVTRVVEAGGAGSLVTTVHTAVITLGVVIGTAISAVTISLAADDPAVAMWTGAGLAVAAAVVLAAQTLTTGRRTPRADRSARCAHRSRMLSGARPPGVADPHGREACADGGPGV